jgi:V/A-type H+/Na+-transporting ATPase subunit K
MAQGGRKFFMVALLAVVVISAFGAQACLAADAETAARAATGFGDNSALALAAAIVVSLSCLAAAIAVGRVGAAALGMASERPELLMKSLIFVVVAEGIAIYGLLMGFLLWTLIKIK